MPVYGHDFEQRCLVEAELLASERIPIPKPYRFWFTTPAHPREVCKYSIHEVYTGLAGRTRIKLVDSVGRVNHWDRDDVACAGLVRDG